METLLAGGIAIEDAIEESKTVVSNLNYKNALDDIKKRLTRGESLSSSFALHHSLFPDYMIKWMVVGEKSGKSDVIFSQLRIYYKIYDSCRANIDNHCWNFANYVNY